MSRSADIANLIMEMLDRDGETEIQRNLLAQSLGCVPSQINYVIASRFTPEQGYIVESRRGGGGYIRIRRVKMDKGVMLMHIINAIGPALDEATCHAHILNMNSRELIGDDIARLMLAATSENSLRLLPPQLRPPVRASIFKQMLLSLTK